MAVPSSGELRLRGDIALEVYGTVTGTNISLGTMSDIAGFAAPDTMSEFYGWSNSVAPSATTNSMTSITETSMTLNGNITSDGGAVITERGFYFGTNSASPTNNTKYTVSGTTGAYSLGRSGLSAGTGYYSWAFATNSQGTTYGSSVYAATIASFVPTYQNAGDAYAMGDSLFGGSATYQRFYINPNTNAFVNILSLSQTDSYPVFFNNRSGPLVTNATNYDRIYSSTGSGSASYSNVYLYVQRLSSAYSFSNISGGVMYGGNNLTQYLAGSAAIELRGNASGSSQAGYSLGVYVYFNY